MNNANANREWLEDQLWMIANNSDGEVFFEDVQAVMYYLGCISAVWTKVANGLEAIIYNRKAAQAFHDDPRHASWEYLDHKPMNYEDAVDKIISDYETEAENQVKFLMGLGRASTSWRKVGMS